MKLRSTFETRSFCYFSVI